MEASLISFLLDKLAGIQQAQRTPPSGQVHARIVRITEEFKVMKVFLESSIWTTTAAAAAAANKPFESWMDQVRMVAFKVEDIIDEYLYLVGKQRELTWKDYLSRLFILCSNLSKAWHGFDSRLGETENEILDLLNKRVGFGLTIDKDRVNLERDTHHYRASSPMIIDEDDVVGIEENKSKLLSWLTDVDTCKETRTIAVWGKGGQGKTTLVANVYHNNTVKNHFDCQVWVTISQNYSVMEILRRMIQEIFKRKTESISNDITSMPLSKLLTTIQENLQQKRYIIVLDDVWDENLWKQIQKAFVYSNNGSRIVVTSRKYEVAKLASLQYIVELQELNEVAKIASQQHIVKLQQLNEVAKIANQLQQLNEVAKRASQQHIVELQQLNEVAKIASQLQQLNEVAKTASHQHIFELQQLNEVVAKIASQQNIVELQQINKEAKRAIQQHVVELQQFYEVAKRASQKHIAELQKINEQAKTASQQDIESLQQLIEEAKSASQQHIVELHQFNEVAKIASQLQKFNKEAEIASQQHIEKLQQLNEVVAKRDSHQHMEVLQQLNEVAGSQQYIKELQRINEVAKTASQHDIVVLQQFIEDAKRAIQQHIIKLQQLIDKTMMRKAEHTIDLRQLDKKEAWILFRKKAFRSEKNNDCPQKLENYARGILDRCQGSPLAIAAIGSLLSFKGKSETEIETEWKKVHDRLHSEFKNNPSLDEVKSILNLSFDDLPYYLKNCFVYCSIFPEDYLITKKKLIRLWVAEGFVTAKSSDRSMENEADRSIEDEAEDYLAELVDRSILQVVDCNGFGTPKAFRMHDVVREVTLAISRKAKFCLNLDGSPSVLDDQARRLSLQINDTDDGELLYLSRSISVGLRSLIAFDTFDLSSPSKENSLREVLISSEMLRVLDLERVPISELPDEVSALFNLHYLGLRKTKVKQLPDNIQNLQSLQTLDLHCTDIEKLPRGVTKWKQLRHLFVPKIEVEFEGTWKRNNLQTLKCVRADKNLVQRLGDMKELRRLGVVEVKQAHCSQLCTSLSKMRNLRSLFLSACHGEQLDFRKFNPPKLQKLNLFWKLFEGKFPLFISYCTELTRLKLFGSQLKEDPLPSIGQLPKLVELRLEDKAFVGQTLHFKTGWFLNLRRLVLEGLINLNGIEIEKGAMINLRELYMADLMELKMLPPGIEHLTHLQILDLFGMPEELMEKLRKDSKDNEDRRRIEHIPRITNYGINACLCMK